MAGRGGLAAPGRRHRQAAALRTGLPGSAAAPDALPGHDQGRPVRMGAAEGHRVGRGRVLAPAHAARGGGCRQGRSGRARARAAARGGPANEAQILIGPEGGFTPDEVSIAVEAGAVPATLGPRILRSETAAIAAAALALLA